MQAFPEGSARPAQWRSLQPPCMHGRPSASLNYAPVDQPRGSTPLSTQQGPVPIPSFIVILRFAHRTAKKVGRRGHEAFHFSEPWAVHQQTRDGRLLWWVEGWRQWLPNYGNRDESRPGASQLPPVISTKSSGIPHRMQDKTRVLCACVCLGFFFFISRSNLSLHTILSPCPESGSAPNRSHGSCATAS